MGLCECGCGQPTRIVRGQPQRFIHNHHLRSGIFVRSKPKGSGATHGRSRSPEYTAYHAAMQRCRKAHRYVDRGIKFLFTSFEQFFADVGEKPSPQHMLDRKNNDGHYEPGNIRWVTPLVSAHNRHQSHTSLPKECNPMFGKRQPTLLRWNHNRWHVDRGLVSLSCPICLEARCQ
jgi:hypothetical protein